jgi:PhnB protein
MSRQYLGPYINFQGRAREAMEFHHTVLGGKLDLHTLGAQGRPTPAGPGDRVMHSRLEADGVVIIASDGYPDYPAKVGENMGIALGGTDADRLAGISNNLAEGGKIKMPLTRQAWGTDGWLTHRFGITWVVSTDKH